MSQAPHAQVGDLVIVHGHRLGEPGRMGEILDIFSSPGHERYRVQWEDGHESVFTPGSDAVIRHVAHSDDERVLIHEP